MQNKNTKSLAEKIDKNSFDEVYSTSKNFYYYSKEYIEKFTKAGKHCLNCLENLIQL